MWQTRHGITCSAATGTRKKWLLDYHTKFLDYFSWKRAVGHIAESLTTTERNPSLTQTYFLKGQKHFQLTAFPGGPPPSKHLVWSSVMQMFTWLVLKKEADRFIKRHTNPSLENSPQVFLQCLPFMIAFHGHFSSDCSHTSFILKATEEIHHMPSFCK